MSAASDPLQAAAYARLSEELDPVPVFDAVPQGQAFPYVSFGEDVVTPGPAVDVEDEEILLTLHAWSDYAGGREVRELLGRIKAALHDRPVTVAGFGAARCLFRHSTAFLQPDGVIRHGVIQFRARLTRS